MFSPTFEYYNFFRNTVELQCCNQFVHVFFTPPYYKNKATVGIRCDKCDKQKKIELTKDMTFEFEDPVLCESIKILKSKWDEE